MSRKVTTPPTPEEKLLSTIFNRGYLSENDSGFMEFWSDGTGAYSAFELRAIATELDKRNRDFKEYIDFTFGGTR